MATLTQYLDYYQSLMAGQYVVLPKATANIRNYVAQAVADNFLEQVQNAYDIDTATGQQLDIIGKYIGVTRQILVPVDTPYFGFWDYTQANPAFQNPNGFYDYNYGTSGAAPQFNVAAGITETIETGETVYFSGARIDGDLIIDGDFIQSQFVYAEFFSYLSASTSNSALSDGQYRFLLRLQIILNSSDSTLASIQNYIAQFFDGQLRVVDNENMTLSYFATAAVPLPVSVLEIYLPNPMGVGITVTQV